MQKVLFNTKQMKKQTAVEWLVNCIESMNWGEITTRKELYDKAKAMEKQQIGKAFFEGRLKEIGSGVLFDMQPLIETFDNYYNETFKSE